mgnify:CR=1 FL=1
MKNYRSILKMRQKIPEIFNDPYDIVKGYNSAYGNAMMFETSEFHRYYTYSLNGETWFIDAYELELHKARSHTPTSRGHRRHFGMMYPGLDIRMDCHDFIRDKLAGR